MGMHTKHRGWTLAALLLAALVVTGCSSMVESLSLTAQAIEQGEARANQAVTDAVGLGALQDSMVASIVYAQVFFAGGYAQGYESFAPGQGVAWELTARDEDGVQRLEIERALLKRTAEGNSWWLLRYDAEDEEEMISEALLDPEYNILKFRYRDPETDTIREWVPETEEEAAAETESEEEEAMAEAGQEDYYRGDFSDNVVGTERVSVPAGRFKADHVLIEDHYVAEEGEETEESYRATYEWWLTGEVPGKIVKYIWTDESDGSSLTGELLAYNNGYTTRLNSF